MAKRKLGLVVGALVFGFLRFQKLLVNPSSLFSDEVDVGYQKNKNFFGNFEWREAVKEGEVNLANKFLWLVVKIRSKRCFG